MFQRLIVEIRVEHFQISVEYAQNFVYFVQAFVEFAQIFLEFFEIFGDFVVSLKVLSVLGNRVCHHFHLPYRIYLRCCRHLRLLDRRYSTRKYRHGRHRQNGRKNHSCKFD